MLMIYGVTAIVAGGLITAAAGLLFQKNTLSEPLRRFLGGQTFGVFAAALMGLGLVMLFAFMVGDKARSPVFVEALVAIAVAAAGFIGVRIIMAEALPRDEEGGLTAVRH